MVGPLLCEFFRFDPSLFHDDDGESGSSTCSGNHRTESYGGAPKSLHSMEFSCRMGCRDEESQGPIKNIFAGSSLGLVEGPHLFKRNGLVLSDDGGRRHRLRSCRDMARSRQIDGPYEMHPDTHLITSKDAPDAVLQRAGHGQYVETPDGGAITLICADGLCHPSALHAGPRDSVQKCIWKDDWLYLAHGGVVPAVHVPAPGDAEQESQVSRIEYVFDKPELPQDFQWLRTPEPQRIFSLTERPGALRLFGRESIGSWFEQALVARRQEHHSFRAETALEFEPETISRWQADHYYNRHKFHAVVVTLHEKLGRVVTIFSCPGDFPHGRMAFPAGSGEPVADGPVHLAMEIHENDLQFFFRTAEAEEWQPLGPVLDAGVVSDEGGRGEHGSSPVPFAGMVAFDTSGRGREADFSRFVYEAR